MTTADLTTASLPTVSSWTGQPTRRVEDAALLSGAAKFVDDLRFPGMLHLVVIRSPVAHARLERVDCSATRAAPGVRAAVTLADIGPFGSMPIQTDNGVQAADVPVPILADGLVRYAGEPVAAVVAESLAAAVDAAELAEIDYAELPVVVDPAAALNGAVVLHERAPDNVLLRWRAGSGDVDGAMSRAARVIEAQLELPRLAAAPMETRCAVARYDAAADLLTVYASAQDPHRPRLQLAAVLRRPPESIRVVVGEVGGSFGSKSILAPEVFVAAAMSVRLHAPVKWVETRSENFLSGYQGRGQRAQCELGVSADGRFLALRARVIADVGAYLYPPSTVPPVLAGSLLTGAYDIPAATVEVVGVATNKVPTGPYRGAGRPEGAYFAERMADLAAADLGLDRAAIRRRNLIRPDSHPYRTSVGTVIDSGDFPALLERVCELVGYETVTRQHRRDRELGQVCGCGLAVFVEPAGLGFWDSATVRLLPGGRAIAQLGTSAHGQGHRTAFAQVLADELAIDMSVIEIQFGDSDNAPPGLGTFASRSAIIGGSALVSAARQVKQKATERAASVLGVPAGQCSWRQGGRITAPGRDITFSDLAAHGPLEATATFRLSGPVYSSGAYAVTVAIDRDTGALEVRRLVAVHDAGRVLNPLLADGQVAGATLQGLAEAISEEVVYGPDGQLLNGSFMGYGILSAAEAPVLYSEFVQTPSPLNPLGVKGVGETGTTGTPAAVASAVSDALAAFGVRHLDPPYTAERLYAAMGGGAGA